MPFKVEVDNKVSVPPQVQRYDKDRKESMVTHANQYKEYAFDFHFDISQREKEMGSQDSDEEDWTYSPQYSSVWPGIAHCQSHVAQLNSS